MFGLQFMYNAIGHANYQQIVDTINGYPISDEMKEELLQDFNLDVFLLNMMIMKMRILLKRSLQTLVIRPLSEYQNHGWMEDANPESYRQNEFYKSVEKTGITDVQVLDDIRENTIHIWADAIILQIGVTLTAKG